MQKERGLREHHVRSARIALETLSHRPPKRAANSPGEHTAAPRDTSRRSDVAQCVVKRPGQAALGDIELLRHPGDTIKERPRFVDPAQNPL